MGSIAYQHQSSMKWGCLYFDIFACCKLQVLLASILVPSGMFFLVTVLCVSNNEN